MKAVILAAGRGTRMRELTTDLPKPMLRVGNRPILEYIVHALARTGITDLFIVTGYKAEVIESHFGDGSAFGVRIQYGRQVVQDGTGKAPELAREFVGESPFILTCGDVLVAPEVYSRMLARFESARFDGLVTVVRGQDVTKGGLFFFDEDFCLADVIEKPTPAQLQELVRVGRLSPDKPVWYNAGLYIFRPTLFEFTARLQKSPRNEYELTDAIRAMAMAGHKLAGLEIAGPWVDVRDPETLQKIQSEFPDLFD